MTEQKKSGYFKNVRKEFKKVVWPTKKQTLVYTFTVIVIALIVAVFCWGLDIIFNSLVGLVI